MASDVQTRECKSKKKEGGVKRRKRGVKVRMLDDEDRMEKRTGMRKGKPVF